MIVLISALIFATFTIPLASAVLLSDLFFARRYPAYYSSVNFITDLAPYSRPVLVDGEPLYEGLDLNGDGLSDVVTNPFPSSSPLVDLDGDGVTDYIQRRPPVLDYFVPSGPTFSDSIGVDYDGDGLADSLQYRPPALDYSPNGLLPRSSVGVDVDGDGISDYVQRRTLPVGFNRLAYSVLPDSTPYGARGVDLDGDGYTDVSVARPTPFGEFPGPLCARCKVAIRFEYCVAGLRQPCYPFLSASSEEICKKIGLHPRCEAVFGNINIAKQFSTVIGGPHAICSALNLC